MKLFFLFFLWFIHKFTLCHVTLHWVCMGLVAEEQQGWPLWAEARRWPMWGTSKIQPVPKGTCLCQSWATSGHASGRADLRKGRTAAPHHLGNRNEKCERTAPRMREGWRSSRCRAASSCSPGEAHRGAGGAATWRELWGATPEGRAVLGGMQPVGWTYRSLLEGQDDISWEGLHVSQGQRVTSKERQRQSVTDWPQPSFPVPYTTSEEKNGWREVL